MADTTAAMMVDSDDNIDDDVAKYQDHERCGFGSQEPREASGRGDRGRHWQRATVISISRLIMAAARAPFAVHFFFPL
jgi:hypothetical protein